MPRSPDLAIFMLTTDNDRQQQRQTKPIALPLAHARGVINWGESSSYIIIRISEVIPAEK